MASSEAVGACSADKYMSVEEFRRFHSIDREVYTILVMKLCRDPMESMQVMAFWLWLERIGFKHFVKKVLSLPNILINVLVDETIICLYRITNDQFPTQNADIPFLRKFTSTEISVHFLYENRVTATHSVSKIFNEVCFRAFPDIIKQATEKDGNPLHHEIVPRDQKTFGFPSREEMTMFVTFSKGYPVNEWEVKEFLTKNYGDNCIESFQMQGGDQPLFAIIVFRSPETIKAILNGMDIAKFVINGKHVWARKYLHPRTHERPREFQEYVSFPY